jgi:hypothetical protein
MHQAGLADFQAKSLCSVMGSASMSARNPIIFPLAWPATPDHRHQAGLANAGVYLRPRRTLPAPV